MLEGSLVIRSDCHQLPTKANRGKKFAPAAGIVGGEDDAGAGAEHHRALVRFGDFSSGANILFGVNPILELPGIDPDGVLSWKVDVLVCLGRVQWSLIRPGIVWCIFVIKFLVFGV